MKTLLITLLLFSNLFSQKNTITEPDYYTKEGFCVVETEGQRFLGLLRFNSNKEFISMCKGKMIFKYENDNCRFFTMKNMKFDIYIKEKNKKNLFKINEIKQVCGKTIIEESTTLN